MHGLQEAEQMDLQGPFTYAIYGPNVGQMYTLVTIRYPLLLKIRKRLHLHVIKTFFHLSASRLDYMDNTLGDCLSHLTKEFYTSYPTTLKNVVEVSETIKRGPKEFTTTLCPLESIIIGGQVHRHFGDFY
uniref:Uncharacterized protein n=1 Tax=Solanum lycopersicum TaxID=4081 RepID=A0A3Q7I2X6_SOLLC